MPISMTANVADSRLRWPTVRVAQPRASTVPTSRGTAQMAGARQVRKTTRYSPSTPANASQLERVVSAWEASISSNSRTGKPVTPISKLE